MLSNKRNKKIKKYSLLKNKNSLNINNDINLFNQLHSLENTIKSLLVKTKTFNQEQQWKKLKSSNSNKKTRKKPSKDQPLESYYFEELNKFQEMYKLGIQVNNSVLESLTENNDKVQSRKVPQVVKFITDNYS